MQAIFAFILYSNPDQEVPMSELLAQDTDKSGSGDITARAWRRAHVCLTKLSSTTGLAIYFWSFQKVDAFVDRQ